MPLPSSISHPKFVLSLFPHTLLAFAFLLLFATIVFSVLTIDIYKIIKKHILLS